MFSPPLEEPFTPPGVFKQNELEYTPPTAFKSEPYLNEGQGSPTTLQREGSSDSDKLFRRLRIPAIELTEPGIKPGLGNLGNHVAAESNYSLADTKSVDSLRDVSLFYLYFNFYPVKKFYNCYRFELS